MSASKQRHEEYWLRRSLANSAKSINYTEAKLIGLKRHYDKAIRSIDKEVDVFYKKYGVDGKVDVATASVRVRGKLTRLDDLKRRVQGHLNEVVVQEEAITKSTLTTTYKGGYYRSVYEAQRFKGAGQDFAKLSPPAVDRAISTAWSGKNYSSRIWGRKRNLGKELNDIMAQGVILGHSNDKMAGLLAERMEVSLSKAKRLIRTESNYIYNQATLKGYEESGIEEYQYVATLDMRTSSSCQRLDGKRFKIKEAQVGRNYPPIHPNCRSTTIPSFDDAVDSDRVARDDDGRNYEVPGDMTYPEWAAKHVPDEPIAKIDLSKPPVVKASKAAQPAAKEKASTSKSERPRVDLSKSETIEPPKVKPTVKVQEPAPKPDQPKVDLSKSEAIKPPKAQPTAKVPDAQEALSREEEAAIGRYVGGESYAFNHKLQRGLPLSEEDTSWIAHMDQALQKMPSYQGDVTRSLYFSDPDQLQTFVQDYRPGNVVQYAQYLSTTKGGSYNPLGQVQMHILDAFKGKDLKKFNPGEQEVLYRRGSVFEVMETVYLNGVYYIALSEVTGEDGE